MIGETIKLIGGGEQIFLEFVLFEPDDSYPFPVDNMLSEPLSEAARDRMKETVQVR